MLKLEMYVDKRAVIPTVRLIQINLAGAKTTASFSKPQYKYNKSHVKTATVLILYVIAQSKMFHGLKWFWFLTQC